MRAWIFFLCYNNTFTRDFDLDNRMRLLKSCNFDKFFKKFDNLDFLANLELQDKFVDVDIVDNRSFAIMFLELNNY